MPGKVPSRQSEVLWIGATALTDCPDSLPLRDLSCRAVDDIYAAAACLLKPAADQPVPGKTSLPAAVLVRIESLRGDEWRFFDLLARRCPAVPVVAIHDGSEQDRKLDICRRKGIDVIAGSALADWLSRHLAVPPAATPVAAETSVAAAAVPAAVVPETPAPAAAAPAPVAPAVAAPVAATPAEEDSALLAIHDLPEDSFVDLPDDLVAHLPDHLDDEPPPHAADQQEPHEDDFEYDQADLEPAESEPLLDDADQADIEPPPLGDADEDPLDPPHLTPWSDAPRPERVRPVRKPPQSRQVAQSPLDPNDAVPPGTSPKDAQPVPQPPRPPVDRQALPDYGLLTPDELRALLEDPDEPGLSQEAQP